ncbi:MAG: hypothetical protein WB697_11730 [Stellaceae bacterium]
MGTQIGSDQANWTELRGRPSVPVVRTLLVGISPIFGDIVRQAVARRVTLDIVDEVESCAIAIATQRQQRVTPELILVSLHCEELDRDFGPALLKRFPSAKVIVFSSDKRHAYFYQMRPVRIALIDLSPDALIKVICR